MRPSARSNAGCLYLGLLGGKLWGVGNFHGLWAVWLPPDGILAGIFHRAWGPHPHLASTLNTVHANHAAGCLGKGSGETPRHSPAAARLSTLEELCRVVPEQLGAPRWPQPKKHQAASPSIFNYPVCSGSDCSRHSSRHWQRTGKKKNAVPASLLVSPLTHTHTHTHSYSHTRTNGNWPGEQFINIFQIATLFLQWLCSKLINVSNKIDHKSKSQVTWGTVWGGNRDEFPGRKKERKKKKYAGHQAAQSVSSRRGQGRQPQSHPDKHCFSSLPSFKPRTA